MQRVIVMGGPGSGKSTLARQLGSALELPVYHLDRYFWKPGWMQATSEEFAESVRTIAELDQWVIDGNYTRTLPGRLARADAIIFLDLPLRVRLPRVLKRRIQYHGQTRQDLGEDCPERIDWVFLKQVVQYRSDRHLMALSEADELQGAEVPKFHLRSTTEVRAFLEQAANEFSESL